MSFEYSSKKGLRCTRYGGLSWVKQTNYKAPVKYGIWAFIYPHFDWWFLSGTFSKSKFKKNGEINHNLYKSFWVKGEVYTHLPVPKAKEVDGWYLTTTQNLAKFLPKQYSEDCTWQKRTFGMISSMAWWPPRNVSKDHYEIFIPRGTKIG